MLSSPELAELRAWFAECDAEEWDREMERDAASRKLDKLFGKSVTDHWLERAARFEAFQHPDFWDRSSQLPADIRSSRWFVGSPYTVTWYVR
ncbi:MAG TPA: hypothetical protein VF713_23765 [Thermoanaerobaculia bacterium]